MRLFRRKKSIARCFAVAMSQAPGLRGTPDSGHCSSAATSASWARSSATPTSRTMRARPAMSLGDSILQTASIARWVSVPVTNTITPPFDRSVQDRLDQDGRGAPLAPMFLRLQLSNRPDLDASDARRRDLQCYLDG